MTAQELTELLRHRPLIASVQAPGQTPLDDPGTLLRLAQASISQGVCVLRLEGTANIRHVKTITGLPVIGLIKREYPGSKVYITPTKDEVEELLTTGCDVIALDVTLRDRPNNTDLIDLVNFIHQSGKLVMADCDSVAAASTAERIGADFVGTTLAGYTERTANFASGPALDLIREMAASLSVPIIAEGRFSAPWQARAALSAGATAVCVGGALNDPIKQTAAFMQAVVRVEAPVLGVDIGGTWLRAGLFTAGWKLMQSDKVALPSSREDRLNWIRSKAEGWGAKRIGISSGGTIDPHTGIVVESKDIIPDHVGTNFYVALHHWPVVALNDGLATAWGHACLPDYSGKRVATIALGTGVGFGAADSGRILMGPQGEYPRVNDIMLVGGNSIEEVLGGAVLTLSPTDEQKKIASSIAGMTLDMVNAILMPDDVVWCGGVGLSNWLQVPGTRSPFGPDAGLYGAAALALFPPANLPVSSRV
ncbi:MAG: putative N-acetylmannosamine-6-phosphate 2-epimerase [Armatimonadetes bacterium]|nr:putative N-acetylmannosamine-6-phosphate 2-epimerase [Armatimonadota bacterium]